MPNVAGLRTLSIGVRVLLLAQLPLPSALQAQAFRAHVSILPGGYRRDTTEQDMPRLFSAAAGYAHYAMRDMNEKLGREGNRPIHSGLDVTVELPNPIPI